MDPALGQAMRTVIGAGVETFVATAGRALENDALPPADHRPWPPPRGPWVMAQSWQNALFAHWPLPPAELRRFLPAGLELDTFDGRGWLGITAFGVAGARLRGAPAIPGFSTFAEVNVRTYAKAGGKPGVLFLSLDAASVAAVVGARAWFRLPYYFAAGAIESRAGWIHFGSRRDHPGVPAARFSARYRAVHGRRLPGGEALTQWLVERYCLYRGADRTLLRAEIHHAPWPIEPAEVIVEENTLGEALGVRLADPPPLLHFSPGVDAIIWPPREVDGAAEAAA